MIKRILLGFLFLSAPYGVVAKNLPLPSFPASFEVVEYQGKKGCIVDDPKYEFAVMENEGLVAAGMHPLLDTPTTGAHIMNLLYHPKKRYGYTLSFINDGMKCVYNKILNVRFADAINDKPPIFSNKSPVTAKDCNFDVRAVNLCGSYESIMARLIKGNYKYDWQGNIEGKYLLTLLSSSSVNQSFYLKTDILNGATIIIGGGKGVYKAYEFKKPN
jgi:hypothetical protein